MTRDSDAFKALEREALDSWTAQEPGSAFADELVAKLHEPPLRAAVHELQFDDPLESAVWPRARARNFAGARWAAGIAAGVLLGWLGWASTQRDGHQVITDEGPQTAAIDQAESTSDLELKIAQYLDQYGRNYGEAFSFHGVVAIDRKRRATIVGHGETAIGNGVTPRGDTKYRVGALTQPIVAVAILRLVERGELRLDESVAALLPVLNWREPSITVEQLLSHRSGLPAVSEDLIAHMALGGVASPRTILQTIVAETPQAPPGSEFAANNANYLVLGLVLEKVTRTDLGTALGREVFEPAGMVDSTVSSRAGELDAADPGRYPGRWAQGHGFMEDETLIPVDGPAPECFGGAGAVSTTALDLVRFARALDDGRLLTKSSLQRMQTPVGLGYALGWVVEYQNGRPSFGHPGGVDGFNASILRQDDGTTFIALANTQVVDANRVVGDLQRILQDDVVPERVEQVAVTLPVAARRALAGRYVLSATTRRQFAEAGRRLDEETFGHMEIVERDQTLRISFAGGDDKRMYHGGENEFFFKDRPQSTAHWQPAKNGRGAWFVVKSGSIELMYTPAPGRRR